MPPRLRRRHHRDGTRGRHQRGNPNGPPRLLFDRPASHQRRGGRKPETDRRLFSRRRRRIIDCETTRRQHQPAARDLRSIPGRGRARKARRTPVVGFGCGNHSRGRAGARVPLRDRRPLPGPKAIARGLLRDGLGTLRNHQDGQPDDERARHARFSDQDTVPGRSAAGNEQPAANTIGHGRREKVWFGINATAVLMDELDSNF
mmetsp:Transcript_5486/g.13538  ORF Transcript_5486/g.13538 Transcript_5486/m.13538 type:complete len:203 (+) Transcript_5486:2926-3534(+)